MMRLKHEAAYYQTPFFKWHQRIGFGISDYACNLAYLLTNTYLLFYYTNCAGISASGAGFMFVVTKVFHRRHSNGYYTFAYHVYLPWYIGGAMMHGKHTAKTNSFCILNRAEKIVQNKITFCINVDRDISLRE